MSSFKLVPVSLFSHEKYRVSLLHLSSFKLASACLYICSTMRAFASFICPALSWAGARSGGLGLSGGDALDRLGIKNMLLFEDSGGERVGRIARKNGDLHLGNYGTVIVLLIHEVNSDA